MNKNTITQEDIDALSTMIGYVMMKHEKVDSDWIKPLTLKCQESRDKLQSNLDAEKELNKRPQLTRIEETVNWIKEALQPMESDIEFEDPRSVMIDTEYEMHRNNHLREQLIKVKGQIPLQELVEKWKAKESKPLSQEVSDALYKLLSSKPISDEEKEALKKRGISYYSIESKPSITDIFIQMLQDREHSLIGKLLDEKLLLSTDEMLEAQKIHQILKNL